MPYAYLLIPNDKPQWDDMSIILILEDAIKLSKKYPSARVEIFEMKPILNKLEYIPTYDYYKNGKYMSKINRIIGSPINSNSKYKSTTL